MKLSKIYSLIKYFVTINGINKILYEDERDAKGNISKKSIQDNSSVDNFFEILIKYYSENEIPLLEFRSNSTTEISKISIIQKSLDLEVGAATKMYDLLDYILIDLKNILENLFINGPGDILFLLKNSHIILFLHNARYFPIDLKEQMIRKFKIHSKNNKIFNLCGSIVIDNKYVCNINKPEKLNSSSDLILPEKNSYADQNYKVKNGISIKTQEGLNMLMRIILEFTDTSKSPVITFGQKKSENLMKKISTILLKKNSK